MIVIIFAACASSMFFTIDNLQNLFLQISIQGIISFGMTFTLIAGEFDMSVGSNLTLCGILFAQLLSYISFGLAIIVVLLFAAALGLINGILVAKLGVCSFIGTLGTMYAYKGLALMLSQRQPVPARTEEVLQVSNMQIGGFSIFSCDLHYRGVNQRICADAARSLGETSMRLAGTPRLRTIQESAWCL